MIFNTCFTPDTTLSGIPRRRQKVEGHWDGFDLLCACGEFLGNFEEAGDFVIICDGPNGCGSVVTPPNASQDWIG